MKRGLRVITGLIVLLAVVFCSGLYMNDGKAFASGGSNPPAASMKKNVKPVSKPAGMRNRLAADYLAEKTAKNNTEITKNTTVTNKTYKTNVLIYPNVTFTVGKNGKIVINGDLAVFGTFTMNSGSLTVNGDIVIIGGAFKVGGTGKVTINKAAAGGKSGYPGGSLASLGLVSLSGSANITINKVASNTGLFSYGYFEMKSASAKVTVNGVTEFDGESTTGRLTAGTLVLNGNFYVGDGDEDIESAFNPSDAFRVILNGTASTPREVIIFPSNHSYFSNYTFSGVVFTQTSWVSIRKNLSADLAINTNNAHMEFQGNLNGHKLTLTSRYIYPTAYGSGLAINGGSLTANGIFYHCSPSGFIMQKAADKLIVNGEFVSGTPVDQLTAGCIDVNGNFIQIGSSDDQATDSFVQGPNVRVIIRGANRLIHFDDPMDSYFTNLELAQGASVSSASVISINGNLSASLNLSGTVYYRGNMSGRSLTAGNLTIPSGASLTVGAGRLSVNGSLTAAGNLVMTNANDVVTVAGGFTAGGDSSTGEFTNGRLYLLGSFTRDGSSTSFSASGDHKTIFCGAGSQTIAGLTPGSKFAKLYIANDMFGTIPASEYYDSLTVTGTTLQGLGPDIGTLSPAFGPGVHEYMLLLPTGADAVTLTPLLKTGYGGTEYFTVGTDSAHVTTIPVTAIPLDGSKTVSIIAHAADNVISKTTTVKIMRINPNLKAGTAGLGALPAGAVAGGAGAAFTVDLPATMASVSFAPVTDNPDSTVAIDGTKTRKTVSVPLGGSVTCNVVVTAQDKSTTKAYTVTFTRHKPVAGIAASTGGMTFNPATASYSIVTAAASATVTVTAGADCGAVTIDGVNTRTRTVALTPGKPTTVTVAAKDAAGKTTTTYTMSFSSVKLLSGIKLSTGTLSPAFSAGTFTYNVNLANKYASVTVTPAKTASCTSMKINGKAVKSVVLKPAAGGKATATITCAYQGGVTQTYTVNVYRIQPVSKISLSTGKLSPKFSPTKYSYTVSLPASAPSVTIAVAKTASCKSITINGLNVTALKLSPVAGGSAAAKVVATAQNGAKYTYTVTVKRAAMLKSIKLSAGKLSPSFNPTVPAYTVTVPSTTTQVTVTPTKASGVKSILINGKSAKSVVLKPLVGGSATATIVATAGGAKTTYTVTVKRIALVTGINVSAGKLSPAFNAAAKAYTLDLPAGVPQVTITPVKGSNVKALTIDGAVVSSKTVSPAFGGSQTVTIAATATDNVTKQAYTVTVRRAWPLTALTVTGGKTGAKYLNGFNPAVKSYDIYIPYGDDSVSVAGAPGSGYAVTINGLASPQSIAVAAGGTVTATVAVKLASNGSAIESYTITIHRLPQPVTALTVVKAGEGSDRLTPPFDYATHDYTATVDGSQATLTVIAAAGCTVSFDGVADADGTIAITKGTEATTTVVVTVSPDHASPIVYTVVINWTI